MASAPYARSPITPPVVGPDTSTTGAKSMSTPSAFMAWPLAVASASTSAGVSDAACDLALGITPIRPSSRCTRPPSSSTATSGGTVAWARSAASRPSRNSWSPWPRVNTPAAGSGPTSTEVGVLDGRSLDADQDELGQPLPDRPRRRCRHRAPEVSWSSSAERSSAGGSLAARSWQRRDRRPWPLSRTGSTTPRRRHRPTGPRRTLRARARASRAPRRRLASRAMGSDEPGRAGHAHVTVGCLVAIHDRTDRHAGGFLDRVVGVTRDPADHGAVDREGRGLVGCPAVELDRERLDRRWRRSRPPAARRTRARGC